MSKRTVDWTSLRSPQLGASEAPSLRERKKQLMRQQLSDTATEMFMDRGFDAVRVADVAEACGVSEKTVYNYFPTKESLLLDRWGTTMASLRTGLADPDVSPIQAAVRILDNELSGVTSWLVAQDDLTAACAQFRRFGTMITATPALQAHQREMTDQLVAVAAEVLAGRTGMDPEDPEPQIAATALDGLWRVQFQSLRKQLGGPCTPAQAHQVVTDDVERAARLLEAGLLALEQLERVR
jgi:AcrR family transcriptional regulator